MIREKLYHMNNGSLDQFLLLMGFIFLAQLRMLSGCGEHVRPDPGKRGEMQPGPGQKL